MSTTPYVTPYVTEVAYVRQFCKELSPPLLRLAAAMGGYRTPGAEERGDFDYCELGAGPGDTTCTLAAAYPRARFVGVDLNPAHVTFARDMAQRGGLENVRFLHQDIAALGAGDMPELDFVCAHGVLSWVSPETQRALIAFAASRLKPGGLLYVSYNALPGWSAVEPLRRLLRDAAGSPEATGSAIDRARLALQLAGALRDGGAQYFAATPAAVEMLEVMARVGPSYTVHEYLQDHWRPMYFADLAPQMAAAGLRFAGELPLHRNVARLTIPAGVTALVEGARDRIHAGQLRDFATNVFLRQDVYVKTEQEPDAGAMAQAFDETPFGALLPADKIHRDVRLPHHQILMPGEPFDSMLRVLCERPSTVRELMAQATLARFTPERIGEALVDLLASDQILPMASPAGEKPIADRYNRAVLQQPLAEGRPVVLASPVAGTGIAVPGLQAVCLRLLTLVSEIDRPEAIRAFVEKQPVKLHVKDRPVTDLQEQARVIAAEVERFRAQRLPRLVALGVVAA